MKFSERPFGHFYFLEETLIQKLLDAFKAASAKGAGEKEWDHKDTVVAEVRSRLIPENAGRLRDDWKDCIIHGRWDEENQTIKQLGIKT